MKIPHADQAVVDIEKLTGYALNPQHPYGKNKAIVFETVLGITANHADLLRDAPLDAVRSENAIIGYKDEFGQRYSVDFELTGTNLETAVVRSGWIIRFDEIFPRLATVYVL